MIKRLIFFAIAVLLISGCSEKNVKEKNSSAEKAVTDAVDKENQPNEQAEAAAGESDTVHETVDKDQKIAGDSPSTTELPEGTLIAVSQLVGTDTKAAEKLLGKAEKEEKIKFRYAGTSDFLPSVTKYYRQGLVAVTFVENKAARIVFTPNVPVSFEDELPKGLELAGLPGDAEPVEETDWANVYENIGGVFSVTAFKKAEQLEYLYIVLEEKYK